MPKIFKVWSHDRGSKKSVIVKTETNLFNNFLIRANEKLNINGTTIVLNKDGTEVDDDESLDLWYQEGEIFMLLQQNEVWKAPSLSENNENNNGPFNERPSTQRSTSSSPSNLQPSNLQPAVPEENEVPNPDNNTVESTSDDPWGDFRFKWDYCSAEYINKLKTGNNTKHTITYFVNEIVFQMRNIKTSIPLRAFQTVAQQIVAEYPKTFQDKRLNNQVLGNGCHTLSHKLLNRNNNLNRPENGTTLSKDLGINCKSLAALKIARAGCLHWQPDLKLPLENFEQKRIFLRNWILNQNQVLDERQMLANMEEAEKNFVLSFAYQRKFLNNLLHPPTYEDIQDSWPILLNEKFFFWHYKLLMGHDIDLMDEALERYSEQIISFGLKKNFCSNREITYDNVLTVITKHFHEDITRICWVYEKNDPIEQLEPPEKAFGWIAVQNNTNKMSFCIKNNVVFEDCTYLTAFKSLFASLFIFNLKFPESISVTMDFIQRIFLSVKLSDNESKAKSPSHSLRKVISFYNKIKSIHIINAEEGGVEEVQEEIEEEEEEEEENAA
ncbi:uncharacterized protein LOC122499583 isoform X2 [Leptopilina heterotoma]|uniref:uncharacterized protein LOC122499583 isoform X2 n=1 Tax=Leptopilina heterotoma TaxID=63436 RepID=UPI001CA92E47|nr:uncharacterized protein LOC122499583 isoform X2 [Leptopilina heterotoma]XP_043463965.1 uncharacterized protein LOC122499583 isoform X2 [Leptopilina heterotoma]